MDILFLIIVFGLIIIGVLSFTLFIRRILINTTPRSNYTPSNNNELEQKLDKIIDLLEKDNSKEQ